MVGLFWLFHLADCCPHLLCQPLGVHSCSRHITKSKYVVNFPFLLDIYLFRYKEKWQMCFVLHAISYSRLQFQWDWGVFSIKALSCPWTRPSFCCQLAGVAWVPCVGQLKVGDRVHDLLFLPCTLPFMSFCFSFHSFFYLEQKQLYMDFRAACSCPL